MVAVYHGNQILGLVTLTEVALLVGIAGSLFLADRVRRQTFDMEPAEIAKRYSHHDAMLHAVREGLIITDVDGDIVLANDEARRLLELPDDCEGSGLRDLVAGADWAVAELPVTDQLQYAAGRVLMVSRSQAEIDGTPAGMVTTLRDRTELQQALHELSEARVLGAELHKQAHEHANHLQMIIALIEMREYDEAVRDNGPGITARPIEQVFLPRVTTKGDGRGFGLSLVRDAVGRLRGRVTAYNDGGAVFEVCIPERAPHEVDRSERPCSVS